MKIDQISAIRRSIVASTDLRKEKISLEMLSFKRPADSIDPSKYELLLGKELNKNVKQDELILWMIWYELCKEDCHNWHCQKYL